MTATNAASASIHHRRLYLAETGGDMRGEDRLEGRAERRFHIRFHLHPDVQAMLGEDRGSVSLRTATGNEWRFLAIGGALGLEDSTYLGGSDQPRRTRQIVVAGTTQKDGARVKWAFRNESTA